MSKKHKYKFKIDEEGNLSIIIPVVKPRNKNLPKGTQKHQDKRKKEKYKHRGCLE